jgi:hypothetical protein
MNRLVALVVAAGILAAGFAISPAFAEPHKKGKPVGWSSNANGSISKKSAPGSKYAGDAQ